MRAGERIAGEKPVWSSICPPSGVGRAGAVTEPRHYCAQKIATPDRNGVAERSIRNSAHSAVIDMPDPDHSVCLRRLSLDARTAIGFSRQKEGRRSPPKNRV